MDTIPISTVLVVGSGAMGSQIAMACAMAGLTVHCQDISAESLERAETSLRTLLDSRVERERITAAERDDAFARLTFTTDLETAAARADLVIEAAVEDLEIKQDLFARLDRLTPVHTILASNSSSFVPSKVGARTERKDRVCNIHFFNPALVMKCVEVVRAPETSDATVETALDLVRTLGKTPVVMQKEINGFIANRILDRIRNEAVFLLEGGYASVTDIDLACRTALGHPMGPFELQDMTGLDIGYATKQGRYEETGDPAEKPWDSLVEKVEAGHLGRKTGQGWYRYAEDGTLLGEA
ncbi:3-hydroxyacyl-CoA dehydrogenase family protein [Brevibacterium litoralis]|uniref:3-hydroxyacyl-CoA dehydrogenase family protein n=1 Tax=Brevibacterium litoralis TaxID=3138935 RepID=UPI0032EDA299